MEQALATNILQELQTSGCIVDTIVMDDDISTIINVLTTPFPKGET